jgi:hypothetical protein
MDCEDCGAPMACVAGIYLCFDVACKRPVLPVTEMRDVPIPEHSCILSVDETNHCVLCGERVQPLRGPIAGLQGPAFDRKVRP